MLLSGWSFIEKTVFTEEYGLLLRKLNAAKDDSGLTQDEIAKRLGTYQRLVSRCLTGERRMDLFETRAFCRALGVSFPELVIDIDKQLEQAEGQLRAT